MSANGASLLSSTFLPGVLNAIALDKNGNVYVAGSAYPPYPTSGGAFQISPPKLFTLDGDLGLSFGSGSYGFVTELDGGFHKILASTFLSGSAPDVAHALTIAPNGNIIVGGSTAWPSFPLRGPVQQSFNQQTGFLASLTPDLTQLVFSTIAGDTRQFSVTAIAAEPDGSISFAGNAAATTTQSFFGNLAPGSEQLPRIDSVVNAASQLGAPLSPEETVTIRGDGFTGSTTVSIGGEPASSTFVDAQHITAMIPVDLATQGATTVTVAGNGAVSNGVLIPLAATSPGVFSVDGSGTGQGYILNADGTRNSPTNPAAPGSAITVFATGVGPISLSGPYAVTATPVNVFVDGLYAYGIAAVVGQAAGLPGNVYQISVYVPERSTFGAFLPSLAAVNLEVNGVYSQAGIAISLAQ
jgi:uncharacterized protein (TIGR03437 family)